MMPDPVKMAEVQKVTGKIKATIEIDDAEGILKLSLHSTDADAQRAVAGLVDQLATGLAQQLQAFFSIEGEIIELK